MYYGQVVLLADFFYLSREEQIIKQWDPVS